MTPEQLALIAKARRRRAQANGQSTIGGVLDSFTQGATFGFGDELTAAEAAVLGKTPEGGVFDYSRPLGERYRAALDAERAQNETFREMNPILAPGAEIAGGLATGLAASGAGLTLMKPGATIPATAGRAAGEGAIYGAAAGAGYSEGETPGEVIGDAGTGAAFGGVTGGVLGGLMARATGSAAARRGARNAPSVQELKIRGGELIERAAKANPRFDGFDDFTMQAYRFLDEPTNGYDAGSPAFANLRRWVDGLEELSTGGTAPTLQQLRMLRARLEPAAANFANPNEARIAKQMKDALDGFMDAAADRAAAGTPNPGNLPAAQVAASQGDDAAREAMDNLRRGRNLYSRGKKGEVLETLTTMAEDRAASTNSGGNFENALRQNFRRILDNPRQRRKFSADEIAAIRRVVRGEPVQNVLRGLGSMSPLRGGLMSLMTMTGTGAGMTALGPVAAVPAVGAAIADSIAKAGTRAQADAVSAMVRGGAPMAAAIDRPSLNVVQQALIRAMGGQAGAMAPAAR